MDIIEAFEEKPHDLNELLQLIVDRTTSFSKAERVIIYLYDDHEKVLWNRAGQGAELMELEFKLGEGIPGQALEKGKSIHIADVGQDSRYDAKVDDVTDVSVKTMLCSPIMDKEKRIGAIQLINRTDGGSFNERDVAFVEAMCAQAAIAIENTILFGSLQETRKHEQELAEKIKEQNEKLQEAYQTVEEENKAVVETSKRVGKSRMIATIVFIILFLGLGLFVWRSATGWISKSKAEKAEAIPEITEKVESANVFTVEPQFLSYPLTLTGTLEPSNIENKFAPFTGRILSMDFIIGEEVRKGQKLLVLSDEKVKVEFRTAKIAEITAREEYDKKLNWATSTELANAKRDLQRAEESMNTNERLYKLGIISRENLELSKDGYNTSKTKLETVEKEGNAQAVQISEFKWENANLTVRELEEKMAKAVITANADGVAIKPEVGGGSTDEKKTVKPMEPGVTMDDGTIFVAIADLTRLKVLGRVEEVDIISVKQGQKVKVTGSAFPGITLEGEVTYVSSQAKKGGRSPYFDISVITDPITEEQRKYLRLGMSAVLSIVTYSNPEALMIPFGAIKIARDGNYVYKIEPGVKEPVKTRVTTTGKTTPTQIEIESGIKAGDKLVIVNP